MNSGSVKTTICLMVALLFVATSIGRAAGNKQQKRDGILRMKNATLADPYKSKPETRDEIKNAVGYAVFDNTGVHLLVLSSSRGRGVAIDNATGQPTYMKMFTGGVGLGMGIKDYRAIFIFKNRDTFRKFVDKGWDFGGEADAAAKAKEGKGGATGGAASVDPNLEIYTITKKGVALQATIGSTKYSKDSELN